MKSGKLTANKNTTKKTNKWLIIFKRYEWVAIILLFLAVCGIFYAINSYTHIINIYNDEFYYLEIAKSIWNGTGIRVRDIPFNFQNILYPAFLAPCMGIADPIVRINTIIFVNTFLLASSIIPLWLITRKLKLGLPYRYIALLLFIISPMQIYGTSFMAEVLYYPMITWLVYFWLIVQEKKYYWLSFIIGIYCYALFLCKEIALFALIIIVIFELFYPLVEKLLDRDSYRSISDYYHWKHLLNPVLYLTGFFLTFVIFKFTVLYGIDTFYHHADPTFIDSVGKFFYIFYAALYLILGISLLACFLPIIYPFFCYKKMNQSAQYTFVFAILMMAIAAISCAYTVSVREDLIYYNPVSPRVITRYFVPAVSLLFIVFLYVIENRKHFLFSLTPRQRKGLSITLLSLLGVFVLVFKGAPLGALSGSVIPGYYVRYQDLINKYISSNQFLSYTMFVLFNLLIAGAVILVHYLFLPKQKRYLHVVNIAIIATSLFATLVSYERFYIPCYSANQHEVNEVVRIENFLSTLNNQTTVLWPMLANKYESRYITTYLSDMQKVMIVDYNKLDDNLPLYQKDKIKVSDIAFTEPILGNQYSKKETIEYIIIPNYVYFAKFEFVNIELVAEYSTDTIKIYRNLIPEYLSINRKYLFINN